MLGLDNMQNKMRAHIYPIHKMHAIPEKNRYQMINWLPEAEGLI
jgi:hypothetical protein